MAEEKKQQDVVMNPKPAKELLEDLEEAMALRELDPGEFSVAKEKQTGLAQGQSAGPGFWDEKQCIYQATSKFVKRALHHRDVMLKTMADPDQLPVWIVPDKNEIHVCSFGGGPGNDIAGTCMAIRDRNPSAIITVTILDLEVWGTPALFGKIEAALRGETSLGIQSVEFVPIDLLSDNINMDTVPEADIFCFSWILFELRPPGLKKYDYVPQAPTSQFLKDLFERAASRAGRSVFMLMSPIGSVYEWMVRNAKGLLHGKLNKSVCIWPVRKTFHLYHDKGVFFAFNLKEEATWNSDPESESPGPSDDSSTSTSESA